jgi:2-(1,2-epoxy-1,2-dihydrophenyl)acetyl-CoA isomerase
MLLARTVAAEEALRLGLVGEVVADEELGARAQQVAAKLAAGPTVAYAKIKDVLTSAAETTFEEALAVEDAAQSALGATADHSEAVEAFVAKRKPRFQGK